MLARSSSSAWSLGGRDLNVAGERAVEDPRDERTRPRSDETADLAAIAQSDERRHRSDVETLREQRLFVEYDGALVGVISQTDIVGAVATAKV